MITMGHDFAYQNAITWFTSMDILIKYRIKIIQTLKRVIVFNFLYLEILLRHANKRQYIGSKFNLIYSTPSCYLKALNDYKVADDSNRKLELKEKKDDFFPYGSTYYEYWTGYYSSRPALKRMVRQGSNLLQSCKQMASFFIAKGFNYDGDISVMKKAMGVVQHTDAVSGTVKQRVADDYVRKLHKGVEECQKIQNSFYQ